MARSLADLLSDDDLLHLIERAKRLRPLTVDDLPLSQLQQKLELDWQPDAVTLLGTSSVSTEQLRDLPQFQEVLTFESTLSTSYAALTTAGPSLTVPATGIYLVRIGGYMRSNTAGFTAFMSYDVGSTGAVDDNSARVDSATGGNGVSASKENKHTLTAGQVLTTKYRASGGTASFSHRFMSLTRIG